MMSVAGLSLLWTPSLVPTPIEIGRSVKGNKIEVMRFGFGAENVLVIGGVHGDEAPSVPLVERFMNDVFSKQFQLKNLTVYFVPIANPDGYAAKTRANARGVDLNRNMEFDWKPESRRRSNPGPKPYSEPETVILRDLIEKVKPKRILSVHAYANILDYDTNEGQRLAQVMSARNGMKVALIGYPTPGSLGRYCQHHNIPLVTLELMENWSNDRIWWSQKDALWSFLWG
jgi:murein peptide amidase A